MNAHSKETAKNMVSGLILMTVFTLVWTGIAYQGLKNSAYLWSLGLFVIASICFAYYALQVSRLARNLPSTSNKTELKKKGKKFALICAGEGFGIFLAVNIAINLHHPELQVPAIALVVGLHFFPLAKVFNRKMDIYLGIWSTLIALLAITLSLNHTFTHVQMLVFTGLGLAASTSFYGVNMILSARRAGTYPST